MIVCDTGPLVAAALSNDSDHKACVELFTALHAARRELLVPATVIAEVGYLLAREAGARVESLFLQSLADGDFTPVDLTSADFARMADLVNAYESLPLGTTDASVVAVAERLGLTDVATLDRRHFTVVRPRHVDALPCCPETSAGRRGCVDLAVAAITGRYLDSEDRGPQARQALTGQWLR